MDIELKIVRLGYPNQICFQLCFQICFQIISIISIITIGIRKADYHYRYQ